MTLTTRSAFQSSLTTKINDNSAGEISAQDHRDEYTDLSDSVPFFGEDIGALGGFSSTAYNAGTKSSGTFTPVPASGNIQRAVNGGAHTLAPPATDCSMFIQYTNNGSAGAITTSGFTVADVDDLTTTSGHDFFFVITVANGFSWLLVKALQ
jgi:hypothetical protein